jgi:hypothetical protein
MRQLMCFWTLKTDLFHAALEPRVGLRDARDPLVPRGAADEQPVRGQEVVRARRPAVVRVVTVHAQRHLYTDNDQWQQIVIHGFMRNELQAVRK